MLKTGITIEVILIVINACYERFAGAKKLQHYLDLFNNGEALISRYALFATISHNYKQHSVLMGS
ncbi:MAG: hypothetical protein HOD17_05820 [Desulfobacteraceae bacterium]|jgi:hypothetical protein|nr:hypothetical protein [Desulfobacteraceae bacterium]